MPPLPPFLDVGNHRAAYAEGAGQGGSVDCGDHVEQRFDDSRLSSGKNGTPVALAAALPVRHVIAQVFGACPILEVFHPIVSAIAIKMPNLGKGRTGADESLRHKPMNASASVSLRQRKMGQSAVVEVDLLIPRAVSGHDFHGQKRSGAPMRTDLIGTLKSCDCAPFFDGV